MKHLLFFLGIAAFLFACEEPLVGKQTLPSSGSPSVETRQEKPFVSFSLDKQNIVYVGFDNPITIHTNGLKDKDLEISTSAGVSYRGSKRNGILRGKKQGAGTIAVRHKGEIIGEYVFRMIRMPDPLAYLGSATSGMIEAENFKAQSRIYALIRYMDIEGTCQIIGFQLLRVSNENDRSRSRNIGGDFDASTLPLIQQAAAGDIYQFTGVKAKCPGDEVSRELNPLAFEIR